MLKHVDGGFQFAWSVKVATMKSKGVEMKIRKEKGGGRLKFRNVDGDVP